MPINARDHASHQPARPTHLEKQPEAGRLGLTRNSSTAICSRKRLTGSAGGYGTAALGALDLIDELLEELEMPNRQIQLTAAYIKKLTSILRELDTYVFGQFNSIINYAAARRSGKPISTAQTESAVHRLLHRRMTAKQQMRWSPRGAHFMLKVRTSVMNGTFEQDHIALANRRASSNVVPHNTPNFETVSSAIAATAFLPRLSSRRSGFMCGSP